jgi:hypothetical protein
MCRLTGKIVEVMTLRGMSIALHWSATPMVGARTSRSA